MSDKSLPELQPGDVLFYRGTGVFSKLIMLKTWADESHCEMFAGPAITGDVNKPIWGSRDPKSWFPKPSGGGVNFYPFRDTELVLIRRPTKPVSLDKLKAFCLSTLGQQYDWLGLLSFFRMRKGKPNEMFCSEALTRALREATGEQLFAHVDADQVSPGMLAWTPELEDIWSA